MINVELFTVGPLFTNCYLVYCSQTREAIVIDPGFGNVREAEDFLRKILQRKLNLKFIVNTHGHPDHTSGNGFLKEKTSAPILIHRFDASKLGESRKVVYESLGFELYSPPADIFIDEGDIIKFGNASLKVLYTPGHSKGSVSLVGENCVFSGDTLFAGSIGRYDFPDSSFEEIMHSLKEKILILPDDFIVYPGHGPITTIGEEKRNNPFLRDVFS